ncbi:MAG: four helix bundle protein [Pseudomonadota bacterium]|nr:MAG: four helix bundle protein [Pseudomonadota bacterium]
MDALENLEVWKRASRLAVDLYHALANCREYNFKDQATRAALSIPSNVAEGYERGAGRSRIQFLKIAKGSCGELWTQLMIGRAAGFLEAGESKRMEQEAKELSRMLYGLIGHFEKQTDQN